MVYMNKTVKFSKLNYGNASKHHLYRCWASMKNRCYNEKDVKNYQWYGGRGIKVCDRWIGENGFWNFVNDMGPRPDGYSIDRIDVDGDYCPENCRWSSVKEQSYNRRNNLRFNIDGKEYNTEDAAAMLKKNPETLRKRIRAGFSANDIVSSSNIRRQSKKVLCVETGKIYKSIEDAARDYGVSSSTISACLNKRVYRGIARKTSAGRHWKFVDENYEIIKKELEGILGK